MSLKKRLSRSRLLKRIGRNVFAQRELTMRHKRMCISLKRGDSVTTRARSLTSSSKTKRSNFGLQLEAKQRISAFYGALPASFLLHAFKQTTYKSARQIQPAEALFVELESRLDVVLVRAHWASSLAHSRQLICHGWVRVNNRAARSSGLILNPGDFVVLRGVSCFKLSRFSRKKPGYSEEVDSRVMSRIHIQVLQPQTNLCRNISHLEINYKTQSLIFLYNPQYIQWPLQMDLALFARFFQRS